ncbi:MAG: 4Fe-4S dicluster domain-containing protein [Desulfovibrio sp.]|nr:MAG: 4Fe-4S dicluster domain-containing protein [Desulfovibrio sp.]
MPLITGRARECASVVIDHEACTGCGLCVKVCKGAPLAMVEGRVEVDQSILFGCIGCGQCAVVCPEGCITVSGRDLDPSDIFDLPPRQERADYPQLLKLLQARRSVRKFADRDVDNELVEQILAAVCTAPMGLPPSDTEILVLHGREKVQEFAADVVAVMAKTRWFFSRPMRVMLRPFWGKAGAEQTESFLAPALEMFVRGREKGEDWLMYDAPLAMYFHTSAYADLYDPIVAATYAVLAAESLGLGTCFIGTPAHFIKNNKKLNKKYAIPPGNQHGIAVIFGHPSVHYKRGVTRRLAGVTHRR